MESFLKWRDEWLIGIEPLDEEHRVLVRLLNNLAKLGIDNVDLTDPSSQKASSTQADAILLKLYDDVVSHIRQHFAREETFMEAIDYPDRHHHQRAHLVQIAGFVAFRSQLAGIGSERFESADINWIKMWFLDHVFGEDQEYANHFKQHGPTDIKP